MASNFHSPPSYWLQMPLVELAKWAEIANRMMEEEREKRNRQRIGPGL